MTTSHRLRFAPVAQALVPVRSVVARDRGGAPKRWRLMVFSQGSGISQETNMAQLDRITQDPGVMGGKPCIRGMRVTVGMIVGQIGAGHSIEEVLADYPYLEREDVLQALRYAAWLAEEREVPLPRA